MADPAFDPFATMGAQPIAPAPATGAAPSITSPAGYDQPMPGATAPVVDPAAAAQAQDYASYRAWRDGTGDSIDVLGPETLHRYQTNPPSAPTSTPATRSAGFDPFAAVGATPVAADAAQPDATTPPAGGGTHSGLGKNIGAGLMEGAADTTNALSDPVGNLIGRPVAAGLVLAHDLVAPLMGREKFTPEERAMLLGDTVPQIGTRAVDAGAQLAGAPTPDQIQPSTPSEALYRTAARGAAGTAALGAGGAAPLAIARSAVGAGTTGAVGALSGQLAADSVPDEYKPLAQLAGGMVGGTAATVGMRTASAGTQLANTVVAPFFPAGQRRLAGQRIAGAATDLPAAQAALDDPNQVLVPDSLPTTAQVTGDPGLGTLERGIARSPGASAQFIDRAGAQNTARVNALEALSPANASPESVGIAFRQQLQDMEDQHTAAVQQAMGQARQATTSVGGNVPAATSGQQASAQQQYGARLRASLDQQNAAAETREKALWKAIDPDESLRVDMRPVRERANEVVRGLSRLAAPMTGEEAAIFKEAHGLENVHSFSDLSALRSRLTTAIAAARTDPAQAQSVRRLGQLLDSVHDAMGAAAGHQAERDAAAVKAGVMTEEETSFNRLQAWQRTWYGDKEANATSQVDTGTVGRNASGGPGGVSSARGGPRQARGGSGSASGASSLQGEPPLAPNFDAEAAARYKAARDATAARHATYTDEKKAPGVSAVLRGGQRAGEFTMPDSSVPAAIFSPGKGAAERVQAYVKAGGDVEALRDYAAFDLRRSAEDVDGTLNPAKLARWQSQHDEALSAPEMGDLKAKMQTAAGARAVMDQAAERQATQQTDFLKSAAGKFLGDADPVGRMGAIMRAPTARADMADLVRRTANDPVARAGLQAAAAEYMQRSLLSNNKVGAANMIKSDQFQTFIRTARPALVQLFSPEQVQSMEAIAADLQRANLSIAGSKVQGGSDTAQNSAAIAEHAHGSSALGAVVIADAAEKFGVPLVEKAGVIGIILNFLRNQGLGKVDKLTAKAMLDPMLARLLLNKVTNTARAQAVGKAISLRLAALAASQAAMVGQAPSH